MQMIESLAGATTAVTGFEKGSGKTTFLGSCLPVLRRQGPVALFTIGMDGAQKHREGHRGGLAAPSEIHVEPGDIVLTTEGMARASSARFEILDALSGKSALGRLMLARAQRRGSVTLVGCEHLSQLASCIAQTRLEGWAQTVLVDGAVNRITQVGALSEDPSLGFVFTLRVDPSNLSRVIRKVQDLISLNRVPLLENPMADSIRLILDGPLTSTGLANLPDGIQDVSLEDFTKVFLEGMELRRFLSRYGCTFRQTLKLRGFVVVTRNMSFERFMEALGPEHQELIYSNPLQVAS